MAWMAQAVHQEGSLCQESMAALGQKGCGLSLQRLSEIAEGKQQLACLVMVFVQAPADYAK